MLDIFDNNPWINVFSFLLAIAGIIVAYYFYLKAKREKRPVYNVNTISLFEADPVIEKKLEIKYNGKLIDNLSLTQFAFWNAGRESIRYEDIAANDPFLITTDKNFNIFEFEIIDQNIVNNFSLVQLDDNTIQVKFYFVDFNDGFVVNIFHLN